MSSELPPEPTEPTGWGDDSGADSEPAPRRQGQKLRRTSVGAVTLLVVMSLLYGPNQTFMVVAMLTICTAGIGLIPMLFASWLTGLVVLAVWDAVLEAASRPGPTLPQDASRG